VTKKKPVRYGRLNGVGQGATVGFKAAFAPPGTPAHLLERAAAIVAAAEAHEVPAGVIQQLPVYREVKLRIDWNAAGVALTEETARIIVAATSPNPVRKPVDSGTEGK